jgi:hypothetical protein
MMNIHGIEREARHIMRLRPEQIKQQYRKKKVNPIIYGILEENNWHSENSLLSQLGAYGKPVKRKSSLTGQVWFQPQQKTAEKIIKDYDEYRRLGGKGLL